MQIKTELNTDIEGYLTKTKNNIDDHFKRLFSEENYYIEPKNFWEAVKYSILNGGKRIRGTLCLATFESIINATSEIFHNISLHPLYEDCITTSCSIELIHSMSLVHDDLPSMDNDDLRRGKPSCHKVFGEANAILAGDAMLSLAFFLLTNKTKTMSLSQKVELVNLLSSTFTFGLVPGQVLDLSSSGKTCNKNEIEKILKLKTAELIKSSIICGAILAYPFDNSHKRENILNSLNNFGTKTGIAFQIIDDILDVIGDTKTIGKTSGKDEKQKKLTFPALFGIEGSKEMAKKLVHEAKTELKKANIDLPLLSSMADFIVNRIN